MQGLFPFIVVLALGYTCTGKKYHSAVTEVVLLPDTTKMVHVDFAAEIIPILKSNCTPCHFHGGKMYSSMPFDSPKTILDHPDGVLKRFKDPDELKKLKSFLEGSR